MCRYAECRYGECYYAECRYAKCHYAECRYAECRYTECRGAYKSGVKNMEDETKRQHVISSIDILSTVISSTNECGRNDFFNY